MSKINIQNSVAHLSPRASPICASVDIKSVEARRRPLQSCGNTAALSLPSAALF